MIIMIINMMIMILIMIIKFNHYHSIRFSINHSMTSSLWY